MQKNSPANLALRGVLTAISAVAPTAFPAALAGSISLHDLALWAIIPAAVALGIVWILLSRSGLHELAVLIRNGAIAGALATVALEAVPTEAFDWASCRETFRNLWACCCSIALL